MLELGDCNLKTVSAENQAAEVSSKQMYGQISSIDDQIKNIKVNSKKFFSMVK